MSCKKVPLGSFKRRKILYNFDYNYEQTTASYHHILASTCYDAWITLHRKFLRSNQKPYVWSLISMRMMICSLYFMLVRKNMYVSHSGNYDGLLLETTERYKLLYSPIRSYWITLLCIS